MPARTRNKRERKQSSPETLRSIFGHLFETTEISVSVIKWPPDAFCFVASVLQKSSAYTLLVGESKPNINFAHGEDDRAVSLDTIGQKWRAAAARGGPPPTLVRTWVKQIEKDADLPLGKLLTRKRILAALINLLAAADEACAGIGISLTSADNDTFTKVAELQLFPRENGSTLCKRVHPSRARVLPKCHTAQKGLTIRSFSHFLALVPPTEVCPEWYSFCADTNEHALNLLLVPWPVRVIPKQFRASRKHEITDEVERGSYGLFTFDPIERPNPKLLRKLIASAEEITGRIDGVIFPELALTKRTVAQVSKEIVREDRFMVAGVGQAAQRGTCGENYIRFDVMLKGGEYLAELKQTKHHRWKLDKNQIIQYGIGASLHPEANWWEHIQLTDRRLILVTLKPWLTTCVLLCEDLARADPLGDLVRSVGPNLVISLLMDGPQISDRWPGRYATTLADDPGCSVLTLTSSGMSKLSKTTPGIRDRSDCIALWKDARTGSAKEIVLPATADAVVLNIAVEYCEEWTADGRGDGGNAGHPYLAGQHPISVGRSRV